MSPARTCLTAALMIALIALLPSAALAADVNGIGAQMRLTRVGPDGNTTFTARDPAIAYNSRDAEFLVAWVGRAPNVTGEAEVLGMILDRNGVPKGDIRRLSTVTDPQTPAQPVLGYSPVVNQYILGYIAPPLEAPNNPAGQRELIAQVITATGAPSGNPARISDTDAATADADQASDPAVAYDNELDQFRFVWVSDAATEGDFEVRSQRVSSSLVNPDGFAEVAVSGMPAGDADDPAIAFLPAQDRWAIVWEGVTAASETEILVEMMGIGGSQTVAQAEISSAGGATTPSSRRSQPVRVAERSSCRSSRTTWRAKVRRPSSSGSPPRARSCRT